MTTRPFAGIRHAVLTLAAVLAAALALPAMAQTAAEQSAEIELMYRDALRSIAEGRNSDASDTLRRVVDKEPLHAGAWLDLALVQCGLGHEDEAERLFRAIEQRFDPPPGILQLIGEARAKGCDRWQPRSSGSIQFGRGIDQNVNQGTSNPLYDAGDGVELPLLPDFLPQHDQYSMLSLDYMRDLTPNGAMGFVQLQGRRNDTMRDYDSNALFLGAETPWRMGRWTLRASALGGVVTLGGKSYQRVGQLQAQVGVPLPLPPKYRFTVLGGVTRANYLTLANFDGMTTELRGQLVHRDDNHYFSASFAFSNDHALDARPGGNRHGNTATILWRQPLAAGINGEFAYTRQQWRGSTAYAPGLINIARDQRTQIARATFSYPVNRNNNVLLELRKTHNEENISLFQYHSGQMQLSWQWLTP
ncbi:bacterial transcriptional activator domain-containing protein [Pseudoduganella buxea]|uniref:Tetratricopeptide repeat protein n=1 Tax=Pseudoduganella buxea TaxID=1949069 RepID=A0ABQ1KTH0_9BURK|nr:bacterial transcriptional activator domain-containing protein [Pseudoduganella buxea]GGC07128.1 hypothetical protein GCM10011572_30890 [Pseudoduganella buxea]